MKKRTKIGIIGGIAYIVLKLLSYGLLFGPQELMPIFSYLSYILLIIIFPAVGAYTSSCIRPPRDRKQVSKESAIAGLITGSICGAMVLMNPIIVSSLGLTQQYFQLLSLEAQEFLAQSGVDSLFTWGGQVEIILCVISVIIVFGVLLSTLGGLVYSSLRKDE